MEVLVGIIIMAFMIATAIGFKDLFLGALLLIFVGGIISMFKKD